MAGIGILCAGKLTLFVRAAAGATVFSSNKIAIFFAAEPFAIAIGIAVLAESHRNYAGENLVADRFDSAKGHVFTCAYIVLEGILVAGDGVVFCCRAVHAVDASECQSLGCVAVGGEICVSVGGGHGDDIVAGNAVG